MNILVVGLGSMGKRRIRLMQNFIKSCNISGVDADEKRRKESKDKYNIKCYVSLEDALKSENLDCAFICTPPLTHSFIIKKCLEASLHIFSEINLVSNGYIENIKLAKERKRILFLSSTFLYRHETIKIKDILKNNTQPLNYNYHVGQYLPDWHPWENYQSFFVGNKLTNGCKELLAIELPWLLNTFGEIDNIIVKKSRKSTLQIDYDDNYIILLTHKNGNQGILMIDVISRKPVRRLEVYSERIYFTWNGDYDSFFIYDYKQETEIKIHFDKKFSQIIGTNHTITEEAYLDEIKDFFASIEGKKKPLYSFEEDLKVLKWIDKIENEYMEI